MKLLIPLSQEGAPLLRQIYDGLRKAVLTGVLRPGERIPSSRDLAIQLGVSRTIVVLAYEQLSAEGFIAGLPGSGTYVSEACPASPSTNFAPVATFRLSRFGMQAEKAAAGVYFPEVTRQKPLYDFAYVTSDVDVFPFAGWRRLLLRCARNASVRHFEYGPAAGSSHLREAIAVHLRRSRAVVCDDSQVIIVNGSQQALDLIARVLIERGDRVAIENPQYQGTREALRAAGALLMPVPVDRDGLNPDGLPNSAQAVFVTPSHQFPTGAVLPLSRRVALLQWAEQTGAVIVEDDYDGEFRYDGHPLEALQSLDTQGRVIYMGTFSRTIFPSLRIGYLVVPKVLINAFTAAKWLSDRHTATLEQQVLAEFISGGGYERHLRNLRRSNAARRNVLLEEIQKHLKNRVEMTGDGAGSHVVLWPRSRHSEHSLVQRAATAGVRIYGISGYFLGSATGVGLMLGYARLREREIREGIRRLAPLI